MAMTEHLPAATVCTLQAALTGDSVLMRSTSPVLCLAPRLDHVELKQSATPTAVGSCGDGERLAVANGTGMSNAMTTVQRLHWTGLES